MKERIEATHLWVQINRKPEYFSESDGNRINYCKAFMPNQFESVILDADTYITYTPVAIWKCKLKNPNL